MHFLLLNVALKYKLEFVAVTKQSLKSFSLCTSGNISRLFPPSVKITSKWSCTYSMLVTNRTWLFSSLLYLTNNQNCTNWSCRQEASNQCNLLYPNCYLLTRVIRCTSGHKSIHTLRLFSLLCLSNWCQRAPHCYILLHSTKISPENYKTNSYSD